MALFRNVNVILSNGQVVFSCGSGGTAAGLAIAMRLSGLKAHVHAVCVCDDPEYFYRHIEEVAGSLGINTNMFGPARSWLNIYDGTGIGYASSTAEELQFIVDLATRTGVILDPVYSGKGLYHFIRRVVVEHPGMLRPGEKVLFIHTGGIFGLYEKETQLLPLLPKNQVVPLNV